jgi:DNA-binding NarL/FixJ family response regulator
VRKKNDILARKPLTLTTRERQVLNAIVAGLSTAQIARRLRVQPGTISNHRQSLRRRLGVSSGAELIQAAVRHGMLKAEDG